MNRLEGFYALLDRINELSENSRDELEAELESTFKHLTRSIMVLADKNEMTGEEK